MKYFLSIILLCLVCQCVYSDWLITSVKYFIPSVNVTVYLPINYSSNIYNTYTTLSLTVNMTNVQNYTGVAFYCLSPNTTTYIIYGINVSNTYTNIMLLNQIGYWSCVGYVYNSSYAEYNTTSLFSVCPSYLNHNITYYCYSDISVNIEYLNKYYNIDDNIIIWATLVPNSKANSLWLFSTNGVSYPMIYSITKNSWYVYYKIRQKQEVVTVESFFDGSLEGVGEVTVTINPIPQQNPLITLMFSNVGYFILFVIGLILAILAIMFILQMVLFPMVLFKRKKKNKDF